MRNSVAAIALVALLASGADAKPGGNPGNNQGKGQSRPEAAIMHGKPSGVSAKPGGARDHAARENRRGARQFVKDSPDRPPRASSGKGPKNEPGIGARQNFEHGRKEAHLAGPDWRNRGSYQPGRILKHRLASRHLVTGCPPGLAKKFNGCMPPGLARRGDWRLYYEPGWWGFSALLGGRYFYGDGYLFSLGGDNRINGFIPLLAGALSLGNPWPIYYEPRPLAPYYVEYYDLGPPGSYRYADNVIYRVNPETAVIVSVAALMTGDQFLVGQPMPAGYGVYNVPYAYRARYYDRPDAYYRYADGYIYEVDPSTMLIASAISLSI